MENEQTTRGNILRQDFGFVNQQIRRKLKDLTPMQRSLWGLLANAAVRGEAWFPDKEEIKAAMALDEKEYLANFKELVDRGYLRVTPRRGEKGYFMGNYYDVLVKPDKKKGGTANGR